MLLSLDNVTKMFADRTIFTGVSLKVEEGDRIGLVGPNGAGKSTLLGVLDGTLPPDAGERAARSDLGIGFLHQQSGVESGNTIYEEMRAVFRPLLEEQKAMKREAAQMAQYADKSQAEYLALADSYARRLAYFEANDGYNIDVRIKTVLGGMGFGDREMETVCGTLSGGEKTRLALAKLLLQNPELLMLDEPTNHLDFATLQWLEDYLQTYKGTLIVVSHDRYFLDKICTKIWEVAHQEFTAYKGNYSKFVELREAAYERQLKEYEAQQQEIAKLTDYIARNKTRASTSNMAKSREKELARIELVKKPPRDPHPVHMHFSYEQEPVKDVLHVEGMVLRVGGGSEEKLLCDHSDFDLMRGEKVALVGRNGVGKSSFLKALLGQLEPDEGRVRWGRNVKVSYFEQEQLHLNGFKTVLEELWDRFPQTYEQEIRTVLGNLGFSGESIYKKVEMLSGGERARLKFAIMTYERGNVLLMDEPTNHLDLSTKEVLDQALMEYEGTLLMVSHDRYLLSRVPTRIVEMFTDQFVSYQGGYENYLTAHQSQQAKPAAETPREEKPREDNGYFRSKRQRAEQVARKKRFRQVEEEITALEQEIDEKQGSLTAPEVASDYQKVGELCAELDQLRLRLGELMEEWTALSEDEE